jgi:hypothetical protein
MPATTSRLALVSPIGADAASEFRVAATASNAILDNAALWLTGTLAARASISPLVAGTLYKGTDTGLLYHYDGTAWTTVLLAGAWVSLTLAGSIGAGTGSTPSIRLEGDIVRLKGQPVNNTGSPMASGLVASGIPASCRPTAAMVVLGSYGGGATPTPVSITTAGSIFANCGTGLEMNLDGLTYTPS